MTKGKSSLKTARILVVNDDHNLRNTIQQILTPLVAKVVTACDGLEGLGVWQIEQPDVVIANINLPGIDGVTMSKHIRALDPDAELVVLTASSSLQDLVETTNEVFSRYVFAPIDQNLLIDAIRKCFASRLKTSALKHYQQKNNFYLRELEKFSGQLHVLLSSEKPNEL